MSYKTVIQAGATGSVGKPVFDALKAANFSVTILTRLSSKSQFPPGTPVKRIDYNDSSSLVNALKGFDALVLTLPLDDIAETTKLLTEAAIQAGVKRVIPSEFGVDTNYPSLPNNPIYSAKIDVSNYLERKASEGKITYTNIYVGLLLDWGVETGFLGFDLKNHIATVLDGGSYTHRSTTLATLAKAVVGTLQHPDQTSNKCIHISDDLISQNDILEVLEQACNKKWTKKSENGDELFQKSKEAFLAGDRSIPTVVGLFTTSVFGEDSCARWKDAESDNKLIGLPEHPTDWKKIVEDIGKRAI